jgi:hypothetical protein
LALGRIVDYRSHEFAALAHVVLDEAPSTANGLSLSMVQAIAERAGMHYQAAHRGAGAAVIIPAVTHWKVGHYAALVHEQDGRYLIQDASFGRYRGGDLIICGRSGGRDRRRPRTAGLMAWIRGTLRVGSASCGQCVARSTFRRDPSRVGVNAVVGWILSRAGALTIAFALARLSQLGGDGIQANIER